MTTITVYVPRDSAARSVGADEVADRITLPHPAGVTSRRPQRLARHALARAAGRGRDRPTAASATARSHPRTSTGWSRPGMLDGADIALASASVDEMPWLQRPAAAHVRPGRRDRSALAPRTTTPTAASRACGKRCR